MGCHDFPLRCVDCRVYTVKRAFWAPRMRNHVSQVRAKMTCRFYFLMVETFFFFFEMTMVET